MHLRILVVEDSSAEIASWQRQFEHFNAVQEAKGGFTVSVSFVKSRADAEGILADLDFDGAIVDLGLGEPDENGLNADGNAVVELVLRRELAVVAIFTGQPKDANPPQYAKEYLKVFSKGGADGQDGTEQVMQWICLHAPMMLSIRTAKETVQKEMAALFSRSIWPRWRYWMDGKEAPDAEVAAALSRHLASHVYASLLESAGQKLLPEEWYFVPPIRPGLRTGDLLRFPAKGDEKESIGIVITPRCDLAGNPGKKNTTYQFARCEDVSKEWDQRENKRLESLSKRPAAGAPKKDVDEWQTAHRQASDKVRSLVQHGGGTTNYHFLPRLRLTDGSTAGPFIVRFDQIQSLDRSSQAGKDAFDKLEKIGSVAPDFLPSLVERLGAFFSRIGTPDFSFTE